ncbi:MAG: PD40 domain-containing protein [Bacteroidetes bacterium]|jgi:dipeptidyl aminopeptidase/acylaminoacyl peptidase|nr:PD40 domain-containing protein [Bacteroidota bacterium]
MLKHSFCAISLLYILSGCGQDNSTHYPEEVHLSNVRQLTNGGDNAEAYWSFGSDALVFQTNRAEWGYACDQICYFPLSDGDMLDKQPQQISTGKGRTTCSYFLPGDTLIIYSSTHLAGEACPPEPERTKDKYVWPVYESFDIFVADLKGNIVQQLTHEPGYDAEPTVSPNGDKIVFTSLRSGDLELYTMNLDGSDVVQVTHDLGYDGGAFFSPDGNKLVFRASRPKTKEEQDKYKALLAQGLVEPSDMEIFVCNVDGSDLRQVTTLGRANWAPFYHPSGKKILFSTNHASLLPWKFNIYMCNEDGSELEQVTFDGTFDAFPMFSPDGKKLVWSSNRNNGDTRNTNLFIADWKD